MTLLDKARHNSSPPLWLMRQAGRYLSEYREVRSHYPRFLEFCYSRQDAAKVTLQPIDKFGFDAAIIFSDILVIPDALGQEVEFIKGEGPQLGPFNVNIFSTPLAEFEQTLLPVSDALKLVRQGLGSDTSLIGFCGAPWTVATYMINGKSSKDHAETKVFAAQDMERFDNILERLAFYSAHHLCKQVDAGADTLQIFDSWAGSVPDCLFERWVIQPTKMIVDTVRRTHPHVDIIGFPKGAGEKLPAYVEGTGIGGVGLDYSVSLDWAREAIPDEVVLQGNLDPTLLVAGGDILVQEVDRIHRALESRPYIFNLGHGILPITPVEHVEQLVEQVRGLRS